MNFALVIFPLFWGGLGLLFSPLVNDSFKIKNRFVLILFSILCGIPIAFYYFKYKSKEFDDMLEIDNSFNSTTNKIYNSMDEYLADCNLTIDNLREQSKNILKNIDNSKNISSIFIDDEKIILDIINNANIPLGIIPIGININNDLICIDFRKSMINLVIVETELNNSVTKWES